MDSQDNWESKKSILKQFVVEGLFGYKTVTLDFQSAAKIISAENGTGKTTLLNVLYWMLTGQFFRLHAINFSVATIVFSTGEVVSIKKDELTTINLKDISGPQLMGFRRWGLNKDQLHELFSTYLAYGDSEIFSSLDSYSELYLSSPYDHDEIVQRVHSIVEQLVDQEQLSHKKKTIEKALNGVKPLYLPTYRRIEANFTFDKDAKADKAESSRDKLIFFGLTDVEDTLKRITATIKNSTLEAYSKINAAFLDKLIDVAESDDSPQEIGNIDSDTMKMVLARIGKGSDDRTVKKIDELTKTGAIGDKKYFHLNYFLSELTQIGRSQGEEEEAINRFVTVVNRYWDLAGREKEFVYDKYKVEVFVNNNMAYTKVPLHVLSSGEKQIISIFSRLTFCDAIEYFVIIDEPELSLSIKWQKLFLPDVISSPKCCSLLAITHSPFVFENSLDKHAGPLKTSAWSLKSE
jgi:predicted ATPase